MLNLYAYHLSAAADAAANSPQMTVPHLVAIAAAVVEVDVTTAAAHCLLYPYYHHLPICHCQY